MCLGFIHARGGCLLLPHVLAFVRLGCYVARFIAKRPSERAWLFAHFRFPIPPALGLNCPWHPVWLWHSFLVPQAAVQRSVTPGPLRPGWRFSTPLLTQPLGWECWNSDALDSVWPGTPQVCLRTQAEYRGFLLLSGDDMD